MQENTKYALISAFLSGESNADQINDLRTWIAESAQNRREFEEIKSVWSNIKVDHQVGDIDELFAKAKLNISRQDQPTITLPNTYSKPKPFQYIKWAAAILLIACFGILLFQSGRLTKTQGQTIQAQGTVKENPAGIKTRIVLPDGTKVFLNSESKLSYSAQYGVDDRSIKLSGEAYFEVVKNAKLPFRVYSGGRVVEALGTAFNVRAFSDEGRVKVILVEGKVSIKNTDPNIGKKPTVILEPGEEFFADLQSGTQVVDASHPEDLLWKDGIIHFKSASMPEVVKTLERWYGVTFSIKGNISSDWSYTGEFSNESLENVLNSIGYSKKFDFEIDNDEVIVRPKNEAL